jgi:hypothetical protein
MVTAKKSHFSELLYKVHAQKRLGIFDQTGHPHMMNFCLCKPSKKSGVFALKPTHDFTTFLSKEQTLFVYICE